MKPPKKAERVKRELESEQPIDGWMDVNTHGW